MLRALYGADTFVIDPYQLGDGNAEGIASGAWWFYQKLGFRSDDRATLARMRKELARGGRSTPATLRALARTNVYWSAGARRADVLGRFPLARLAQAAARELARHGSERACAAAAAAHLGIRLRASQSFERWAPLLLALPGVERWSRAERAALARVAEFKGCVDELEYVRALQQHVPLWRALCALARVRSSV